MRTLSYAGYRFPREVIQRAVWIYLRFTLSFRDVEEMLAERGIIVSYESIRRWVLAFGPAIARRIRAQRPQPHRQWHLDEVFEANADRRLEVRCQNGEIMKQRPNGASRIAFEFCKHVVDVSLRRERILAFVHHHPSA